jgi:hypothetical protein
MHLPVTLFRDQTGKGLPDGSPSPCHIARAAAYRKRLSRFLSTDAQRPLQARRGRPLPRDGLNGLRQVTHDGGSVVPYSLKYNSAFPTVPEWPSDGVSAVWASRAAVRAFAARVRASRASCAASRILSHSPCVSARSLPCALFTYPASVPRAGWESPAGHGQPFGAVRPAEQPSPLRGRLLCLDQSWSTFLSSLPFAGLSGLISLGVNSTLERTSLSVP